MLFRDDDTLEERYMYEFHEPEDVRRVSYSMILREYNKFVEEIRTRELLRAKWAANDFIRDRPSDASREAQGTGP